MQLPIDRLTSCERAQGQTNRALGPDPHTDAGPYIKASIVAKPLPACDARLPHIRTMPRFLVYAPDYPDHLEQRLAVRPTHLICAKHDLDAGVQVYGGPLVPRPGTKLRDELLPEGTPRIAGSFMVYVYPTIEDCWKRIKEDVYWTDGVWDKERLFIEELLG
ncbi:hypothetical protein BD626DRAFT_486627 [Schizophyllum amplum]|uniref:YCII-related domain-containing protein n=1 Tax=Schizophyllum amplum TaxID=97359 RepID=A0A550CMN9_9AGAR|nr:hypothetical protein BD626DRAFT_486627 [Auriculariopsis ampla]